MLKGSKDIAFRIGRECGEKALRDAYAGDYNINWEGSDAFLKIRDIVSAYAEIIGNTIANNTSTENANPDHLAGKLPQSALLDARNDAHRCLTELNPNTASAKLKIFKKIFDRMIIGKLKVCNLEASQYTKTGRIRNVGKRTKRSA